MLIQYRVQSGGRFDTVAYERDGSGTWSEYHGLLAKVFDNYSIVQANAATQAKPAVRVTPIPVKKCQWCDDQWCEGYVCASYDGWRDLVPSEHSFWGLKSKESPLVRKILQEKGIAFEEQSGSRLYSYSSASDQNITMFGLPVSLHFQYSTDRPNWLVYVDITTVTETIEEAMVAYETLLEVVENQYGTPTGGYLSSSYHNYVDNEWNYPMADDGPDYDTVLALMDEDGYAKLCTYYNNLGVYMVLRPTEDTGKIIWLRYHYNMPAGQEEYRPPQSSDFMTFTRPNGTYGATHEPITIGF